MTMQTLKSPVKATKVEDAYKSDIPGAFNFRKVEGEDFWGYIRFKCPCGCGSFSSLSVGLNTKPSNAGHATWQWDGNEETPTLQPSIHHIDHWHGWLENGIFRDA